MLWTKRAHQCIIFQIFECSNESSPNSSCQFSNRNMVYSNFASLFIVMKDNSSVFFQLKPHILSTKIAYRSEIFGLSSGWVKIHKIPHVIFETTLVSFSLNFASLFSVIRDETLYYFDESSPSKCQISDSRFHQIWTLIVSFC